jgi:sugar diacid utilization regulator
VKPTEDELVAAIRDVIAAQTSAEVVAATLSAARAVVHADAAFWSDADGTELRVTAVSGIIQPEPHLSSRLPAGDGLGGHVVRTGDPIATADYQNDELRVPGLAALLGREGLTSVGAVPVRGRDRIDAVIYVFSRDRREFDDDELRALTAIAGAAGALRDKAGERDALAVRAEALDARAAHAERHRSVVGALAASMLEGTPVEQALGVAGERLGIALEVSGLPRPEEPDPDLAPASEPAPMPSSGRSVPIPGAGRAIVTAVHADSTIDATLRLIAAVIGLDFGRRRASIETELRLGDQFVRSLLDGSREELARIWHRASLIGIDLVVPRVPVAIGGETPITRRLLDSINREVRARTFRAQVTTYEDEVIVLWPLPDGNDPTTLRTHVHQLLDACWPAQLSAGIGSVCTAAEGYPDGVREALFARQVAVHGTPGRSVVTSEDLGMYRLFAHVGGVDALAQSVAQTLTPLLAADSRDRSELVHTLRVHLDQDRRLAASARALHIHVNTLRYRLKRITTLLSVDLDEPETRFLLTLALRLSPVLGIEATH